MNRRSVGAVFCIIACILFSVKYLTVAIFMSGVSSWGSDLFNAGLEYVGSPLTVLSIISLILGIFYLVWAEFSDKKK